MKIDAPLRTQILKLRLLWKEAFGDADKFWDAFERTAFKLERCRCVTIDGKVAAALYWFDCFYGEQKAAYVYAVATARAYRGQGICHALMENTQAHLKALGYGSVVLVPASERLFHFYAAMGYRICSYMREFHCSAATEPVWLREIDKVEYARLRRQFLPEGGVVQENENLDFLETQATFYTGEEFLLAACEGAVANSLYGVELLGDERVASRIVGVLGYTEGTFRTSGGDKPFAMYYPLGEDKFSLPIYFGLAFD